LPFISPRDLGRQYVEFRRPGAVEPLAVTLLLSARYRAAHSLKGALVLASHAASLVQFQLTYGFWSALLQATLFAPMIAAATAWFENNRYLAVSSAPPQLFAARRSIGVGIGGWATWKNIYRCRIAADWFVLRSERTSNSHIFGESHAVLVSCLRH
jgi:hypothetical protein